MGSCLAEHRRERYNALYGDEEPVFGKLEAFRGPVQGRCEGLRSRSHRAPGGSTLWCESKHGEPDLPWPIRAHLRRLRGEAPLLRRGRSR